MNITVLDDDTSRCMILAEEVQEYAQFLGIDLKKEMHLEWIAREGLCAPVPHPWKACIQNGEELFYFNFETGESVWDHPSDEKYRNMVDKYRKKHIARRLPSLAMELKLADMWGSRIKSHKPTFKEIRSQVEATCNIRLHVCLVPLAFPGFAQKLMEYADVTQEDIDDAWLDAALDVLGRPAIRLQSQGDPFGCFSRGDDHGRFCFRQCPLLMSTAITLTMPSWAQDDDQFFLSDGPDLRRTTERTAPDDFSRHDLNDRSAELF